MTLSSLRALPAAAQLTDLVWLQTAFLGDIVLSTAAISLVARQWPHIRQHMITTPLGRKALADLPLLASCTAFDKKNAASAWAAMRQVKSAVARLGLSPRRSVLLQVHRSARSSLLAASLRLPSITYHQTSLGFLATAQTERVAVLHEAARIGLLLEVLGMPREEIIAARPYLAALHEPQTNLAWQNVLSTQQGPLVGIAPGSVWGTKRWPAAAFTSLIKILARQRPSWRFVLIGSADEQAVCADIAAEVQGSAGLEGRFMNLAGITSLDDLRFLFPRLHLLVGNDSSPLHYASAFKVPTVAVFGATTPAMGFTPMAPGSVSLGVNGLACRPCSDHGPMTCPLTHFRCMRELSAELVAQTCLGILKARA